jgi:hypothetical protein
VRISGDFDIPVGSKTRKVFSLAAKIISSQFYQTQRLVLCHMDKVRDYVVFPSRWYHHSYYYIESNKVFYKAQLFAMRSSHSEAKLLITRKINRNMIPGHIDESKLRQLTQDLCKNWDTTYSVDKFPPSKEFDGEKNYPTKNRHITTAQFGSIQRIAELVELFQVKYKHLTIRSVWLIKKSKKNDGFQCWHRDFWLGHKVILTIVVNVEAIRKNY